MSVHTEPGVNVISRRERLRLQLLQNPESVADIEILEAVLSSAIPRKTIQPVARALIARFGSFSLAISAPVEELRGHMGLSVACVAALKSVSVAALRLARAEIPTGTILNDLGKIRIYLQVELGREKNEHFRILFLDRKYRVLANEEHSRGSAGDVSVDLRTMVKQSLELNASFLILVHNHPTGNPTASPQDIENTIRIKNVLDPLGLTLLDHIIVGNGAFTSLLEEGFLTDFN